MLPRETLERAAFWDHAICLDCGNEQTGHPGIIQIECEECQSDNVMLATRILECVDFVED